MATKPARRGMKAYVLIETAPGKTKTVKKESAASPRAARPWPTSTPSPARTTSSRRWKAPRWTASVSSSPTRSA